MDLHGVAELNCTNKQNYTIHGVGSADLHGVAELNCANKQNNTQNQTAQIGKQLYATQHNTIQQNHNSMQSNSINYIRLNSIKLAPVQCMSQMNVRCAENACLQIRPTETNCTNRSQKQTEQIQTQIQTKPITKRNQLQNKTNCKTRPTANAYAENATVLISYQNQFNNKSIQYQLNSNNKNAQLSTRSKLLRRSHFREQAG